MPRKTFKSVQAIEIAEATIGADGRITVPKDVRKLIGLDVRDRLMFSIDGGRVFVRRQAAPTFDPFACFTEWSTPEDDEAFANL
jgi:AbrB family looped-hinge helix DNA binding protein